MKMADSQRIEAPREKVWQALNDPDVLKASIPGCEDLVKHSDTDMEAKVTLKVGPVKATFGGKVTLSELDPPNGYRIDGEGSGGVAGFAKGGATVRLEEDGPNATVLHYTVDANVGGKLAQLGARLIDSTAKRLAGEFFETFGKHVAGPASAEAPAATAATAEPETVPVAAKEAGAPARRSFWAWLLSVLGLRKKVAS
ncbi:SRPBCC family protein [Polymorphum gilvum]|uniref:Carbon monoxide dehydrogenase subunit G superfamily n=1 Tax=Polymorphum gilvum (strain LMG 25793 / CGMCC 1.9160 / SL003B-26A1) TaxID=991905 RepID=F2IW47_POLGS|nr:carbon monoxide dehydrogenase subunit G [Polymorphum gilvum]ADZ71432.1 Carbon monoxide dehydrogenase subunit G superfamily [Polymorphum gilvum SL003B-26A1]